MTAQLPSYPPAPESQPQPPAFDKILARLLPGPLRPSWTLEAFIACDVTRHDPPPPRDDAQVEWFTNPRELQRRHHDFLARHMSCPARTIWKAQLKRGRCWLGLASWQDAIRHFMVVQVTGGGALQRYGPLMLPESVFVGPAYTAQEARGQGIYPYVLSMTLERVKEAGFKWAYGSAHYQNEASLRGIRKDKSWIYAGRLLLYRRACGRFRIHAATLENPQVTRVGS